MRKLRVMALAAAAILIAACSSTPSKPKGPDLSGNWVLTTESPMGAQDADMTVAQSGTALSGKVSSQMGSVDYTGTLEGTAVAFGFSIDVQGTDLRIDYTGTVEGDTMKGKAVFGSYGEGTFTAKRKT
ncbi:MAG TPA: hypothetical protein PKE27_12895 [Povalibacter sp.]|uniref:hypothetical protein n=1 Tax=Povalibacter sp. TaxID=1962978 RepID=UPI002BAF009E|nr:hypothetical protein [Povalibacter sp.]HMN45473.1 hypothetical protein [Povalibacter sp.]